MHSPFSESTQHYIRSQDVLWVAENRFREELEGILEVARNHLGRPGWKVKLLGCTGSPRYGLQVYREHWPKSVHYEARVRDLGIRRRRMMLGLHVEIKKPDREVVWKQLRALVEPRESEISAASDCRLEENPSSVLKGYLDLIDLTAGRLVEVLEHLMQTEDLVEKGLRKLGIVGAPSAPTDQTHQADVPVNRAGDLDLGLSPTTKEWLNGQNALAAADDLFGRQFGKVLREVEEKIVPAGWKTNWSARCLQVYRPTWQSNWTGTHYEAVASGDCFREGIVHVALHVEKDTPKQRAVWDVLRKRLQPYRESLAEAGCILHDEPIECVAEKRLDLATVTPNAIYETMEALMQTESFVEEALFLANTQTIWRTDFLAGDPPATLKWDDWESCGGTGEYGGWKRSSTGGRFDAPCVKCGGRKSNHRDGRNIITLGNFKAFHDLANGQKVYGLAVVHAPAGGRVVFHGHATQKHGWTEAFSGTRELKAVDRWQVVVWEGKVSSPEDCNFAEDGLHMFVLVKAPEAGLKLDCVEIGVYR